ncbi:MAG TPA: magnesium transporter [Kiloniellales bacterium]|nr:magnesium transporter [Kiloniellales bacterium]
MSEKDQETLQPQPIEPAADTEEGFELSPEEVYAVEEAVEAQDREAIRRRLLELDPVDQADLLEALAHDDRVAAVEALGADIDPETLTYLDSTVREEVIELMGPDLLARALSQLDSDDAVLVFADLDEEAQSRILARLPQAYRRLLVEGATFEEGTAGRLMQREVVAIPSAWSVGETIDFMRSAENLPDDFYDLYVVNPKHQPLGVVPLSRVLRSRRPQKVTEVMEVERMKPVALGTDQADVANLFRRYGLVSAPVVDGAGRLVGVITVDDVVDVIDEEAEDDLLKLGGVTETDLYRDVLDTTRARLPWLAVNLLTAVLASVVIGQFENALAAVVALAVLMPIVASMGGNAGTQTLTVAVRALAMKDLTAANAARIVGKELIVGAVNGVVFAVVTGAIAWFWFDRAEIGLIIAAAMVINLVAAALSGIVIPLTLDRLKVDPAVASSVFLTTVTDVVGFLAFLGLATLFLL